VNGNRCTAGGQEGQNVGQHIDAAASFSRDISEFEPHQQRIYEGLRSIGEEVASFYVDGVRLLTTDGLETKAYLLAHLAREIEGGLKDILAPNLADTCAECDGRVYLKTHRERIAEAAGLEADSDFVVKWHNVQKDFAKFAHRRGAYRSPREKEAFSHLWRSLEDVLLQLVGGFYDTLRILDRLIAAKEPTKQMLGSLPNLLEHESRRGYFFQKLRQRGWLRPLLEHGYFDPGNNPTPQESDTDQKFLCTPGWPILSYIERMAELSENHEQLATDVAEITRLIADYRVDGKRIENRRTDWFLTKVFFHLPVEVVEEADMRRVGVFLRGMGNMALVAEEVAETGFRRFAEKGAADLLMALIQEATAFEIGERDTTRTTVPLIWGTQLRDGLHSCQELIAKLCPVQSAEVAIHRLEECAEQRPDKLYRLEDADIGGEPDSLYGRNYDDILLRFARDMLNEAADRNPQQFKQTVARLSESGVPILRRLAVYLINEHFQETRSILWSWPTNPINDLDLRFEMYDLLDAQSDNLSEEELSSITDWIEAASFEARLPSAQEDEREEFIAYWKQTFVSPLRTTENGRVLRLYEKYQQVTEEEATPPKHIRTGMDDESGRGRARFGPEEFLEMENGEVISHFKELPDERAPWDESRSGQLFALSKAVGQNPQKFTSELSAFNDADFETKAWILAGLRAAWESGQDINWPTVFEFVSREIWALDLGDAGDENGKKQLIRRSADLIREGTKTDQNAFPQELLAEAESIVVMLLKKAQSEELQFKDLLTSVLNSVQGKVFAAAVCLSLRHARLSDAADEKEWLRSIRSDFTSRLHPPSRSIEFSVTLGKYLNNLWYLDPDWVRAEFDEIFPSDDEEQWRATMNAYLFHAGTLYQEIYELLRDHGDYKKALHTDFENEEANRRVAQHIGLAYFHYEEHIEDQGSLISQAIHSEEPRVLQHLIQWVAGRETDQLPGGRQKVKELWQGLCTALRAHEKEEEYSEVISQFSGWMTHLEQIDAQTLEWLKFSAEHLDDGVEEYQLVEQLARLVEPSPVEVGELCRTVIDARQRPLLNVDKMHEIVEELYAQSEKVNANYICIKYGEFENYTLRSLYETNNPPSVQ
jgi:hypothetical protein